MKGTDMITFVRTTFATSLLLLLTVACGREEQAPKTPAADASKVAAKPATPSRPEGIFEYTAKRTAPAGGRCAIDKINGEKAAGSRVATGTRTVFAGWLAPPKGIPAGQALLVLDSGTKRYAIPFRTGGKRSDVAKQLQRPELATAGYNLKATLAGVEPGEYALSIVQEGAKPYSCPLKKSFTVTG